MSGDSLSDEPINIGCRSSRLRTIIGYLKAAKSKIETILSDVVSGIIRLPPKQLDDLRFFINAINNISNNRHDYIICDNEEGSGPLTQFVNCTFTEFIKRRGGRGKRADALIHIGRCSIITFEHTTWRGKAENFEKFSDTAFAQVGILHWLYSQLVKNNLITSALRMCAGINNPRASFDDYFRHGGLAVIVAPFTNEFIRMQTYKGLLVRNPPRRGRRRLRGYLLQPYTNPYVVLLQPGILQYLR